MRLGWLGCAALAVLSVVSTGGCGGEDEGGGGGSSSGGSSGGANECKSSDSSCYVAGPDGPGSPCMAKADFSTSDVTQLRMSSHQIRSPEALAAPMMQDNIITPKSTLDEPKCNLTNGKGQFNFLMQVDTAKKELTLGGGVPQKLVGPALDGTCWAEFKDAKSGLDVKQYSAPYTESGGTLQATFSSFVMPIYVEDLADAGSAVLVPIHEMSFKAKLSDDKNCVGRYLSETLTKANSCEPKEGFAWQADGTYEGYITVEEADKVWVVTLQKSLCVVLTGDPKKWEGPDKDCKSSDAFKSQGLPKGDWCADTNSAGGCQDAWKLVIDFAAQAIKINGVYGKGC